MAISFIHDDIVFTSANKVCDFQCKFAIVTTWAEQNKYLKDWLGAHSTDLNFLFENLNVIMS